MNRADGKDLWIFGYGSLMWRPGFEFIESAPALLDGCFYASGVALWMLFEGVVAIPAGIDPVTIDFIRNHPEHLRVDPGTVEPGTVIPTPASWHRLDESLRHMGLAPSDISGVGDPGLYPLATGFVGTEAAISYSEFIKRYERVISADDVLNGNIDKERAEGLPASEALGVLDKLVENSKENDWKKKQVKHVAAFVNARGGEQLIYFWNAISKTQRLPNIKALHEVIGAKVVEVVRAARGLQS